MRSEGTFDWEKFNKSVKSLIKSTEFRPLIEFVKTITNCDYFDKLDKRYIVKRGIAYTALKILFFFNAFFILLIVKS